MESGSSKGIIRLGGQSGSMNYFHAHQKRLQSNRSPATAQTVVQYYEESALKTGFLNFSALESIVFDFYASSPQISQLTRVYDGGVGDTALRILTTMIAKKLCREDDTPGGTKQNYSVQQFKERLFSWITPLEDPNKRMVAARLSTMGGLSHENYDAARRRIPSGIQMTLPAEMEALKVIAKEIVKFRLGNKYQEIEHQRLRKQTIVLEKKCRRRSANDLRELLPLLDGVDCLESFDLEPNQKMILCSFLSLAHYDEGEIIHSPESKERRLCIVLEGKATVRVQIPVKSEQGLMQVDACVLSEGHSFGGKNLIDDEPLDCTIVANTPVTLVTLDVAGYGSSLKSFRETRLAKNFAFLRRVPTLRAAPNSTIVDLAGSVTVRKCHPGQIIIQQGSFDTHEMFFVLSGTFKVIKEVHFPTRESGLIDQRAAISRMSRMTSRPPSTSRPLSSGHLPAPGRKKLHQRGSLTARQATVRYAPRGAPKTTKFLEVNELGLYSTFGEVGMHGRKRSASVISIDGGNLLVISKIHWHQFADKQSVDVIHRLSKNYPTDADLRLAYGEDTEWMRYKQHVTTLLTRAHTPGRHSHMKRCRPMLPEFDTFVKEYTMRTGMRST